MKHLARVICAYQTLLLSFTFMLAYFSPEKYVTVYVNKLGEAHIEFVMFLFVIPMAGWVFYDSMWRRR